MRTYTADVYDVYVAVCSRVPTTQLPATHTCQSSDTYTSRVNTHE
jgi:hypothetical protein